MENDSNQLDLKCDSSVLLTNSAEECDLKQDAESGISATHDGAVGPSRDKDNEYSLKNDIQEIGTEKSGSDSVDTNSAQIHEMQDWEIMNNDGKSTEENVSGSQIPVPQRDSSDCSLETDNQESLQTSNSCSADKGTAPSSKDKQPATECSLAPKLDPDHEKHVDDIQECAAELMSKLTEPAKFSYLGLCSTVLSLLFGSSVDKVYRHKTVYSLVKHVDLDSNCYPTMVAISDGHSCSTGTEVFIKSLMNEMCVKDKPSLVATDLVMWALLSGTSGGTDGNMRGRYDARTRVMIRHITWQLHVVFEDFEAIEHSMVKMLEACTEREKNEQAEDRKKSERRQKWKRYGLIGLAAAGGGALIGLTGGLAAPLVAAGAGAVLGASSAAVLGSAAGIAIITSLFGAAGAGLTGYKMKRRVGGIEQFIFRPLTPGKELNITIAISGWLSSKLGESDFVVPWLSLCQSLEQYYLIWETNHLIRLGSALEYILDSLVSVAANEALKFTVLSGLVAAVAWPASLLAAAGVIDNPWSVCLGRAAQVGKQLAEVLLSRQHGHRPVTLIGFSLGARVIYHCLEEMAKRKNHSGVIEDVILLGAPVTGSAESWQRFESVVAGHITNGYCRSDWLLQFLYRTSSRQAEVAGLQPISWDNRRMINIDLTSVVDGHLDYQKNMDTVLSAVGVRTNRDSLDAANQLADMWSKHSKSKSMPQLEQNKKIAQIPKSVTTDLSCENTAGDTAKLQKSDALKPSDENQGMEGQSTADIAPTDTIGTRSELNGDHVAPDNTSHDFNENEHCGHTISSNDDLQVHQHGVCGGSKVGMNG